MATCPICHGFRNDERECECYGKYQSERRARICPAGMIPEAFEYSDYRRIHELELSMQLHPEREPLIREELAKIIREANARYQKLLEYIAAEEDKKRRLRETPRPRLY